MAGSAKCLRATAFRIRGCVHVLPDAQNIEQSNCGTRDEVDFGVSHTASQMNQPRENKLN